MDEDRVQPQDRAVPESSTGLLCAQLAGQGAALTPSLTHCPGSAVVTVGLEEGTAE